MRGEGAGEVTLLVIRGQLLRSSIFFLTVSCQPGAHVTKHNRRAPIVALQRAAAMCK